MVVVIGGERDARALRALGLEADRLIVPPLGSALLAWAALRGFATGLSPKVDRVHAWSAGALAAARLALPRVPVRVTLSVPPGSAPSSLVVGPLSDALAVRAMRRSGEGVSFSCAAVRDAWSARLGLAAAEAGVVPIAALDRAVSSGSAAEAGAAESLRAAWNVEPGERVLLALADHPSLIDARRFIFHCGVMAVAGHRLVGVVPSRAAQLERAVRFTRRHHGAWRIVIDDTPPPLLMHAADVAMPASSYCAWSAALARLVGVPLVSPEEATADRLRANAGLLRVLEGGVSGGA